MGMVENFNLQLVETTREGPTIRRGDVVVGEHQGWATMTGYAVCESIRLKSVDHYWDGLAPQIAE